MSDHILEAELRRARDEAAESRKELSALRADHAKALQDLETARSASAKVESDLKVLKDENKELGGWKEKYEEIQLQIRHDLINQIAEEKRERYSDFTNEQLKIVVEDQKVEAAAAQTTVAAHSQESGQAGMVLTADQIDMSKLSLEELAEMGEKNPTVYQDLIAKQVSQAAQPYL